MLEIRTIFFYDQQCLFCSRCIRWLHALDHKQRLYFAPLGGQTFLALLENTSPWKNRDYDEMRMDKALLYQHSAQIQAGSEAVLEALMIVRSELKALVWILRCLSPLSWRHWLYSRLAGARHRIPIKASCDLPKPSLLAQMLP